MSMPQFLKEETGYQRIQGTKPQTLAYGLNDSPAGLAAWIVEKFRAWSDCDGDVERRFTKDQLLTNIMLYWVPETANSSCRLYYETMRAGQVPARGVPRRRADRLRDLPAARSSSRRAPGSERIYNVQRWTRFPSGGHFAAMEEPSALVDDVRAFFRPLALTLAPRGDQRRRSWMAFWSTRVAPASRTVACTTTGTATPFAFRSNVRPRRLSFSRSVPSPSFLIGARLA